LSESREILPRFISYQLGKELKSLKTLNNIDDKLKCQNPNAK
jgi:hypothetical protein